MKVTDVILNSFQLCGNSNGSCLLLEIADLFEFVDGKVTNKIIGQKLTVVCPQNKFEKFMVKVNNRNGVLSNEEIENAGGSINIYFKNLKGKFYRTSGDYALSVSADDFEVLKS